MTGKEETKSIPITKRMVWEAYGRVKANGGGAGIDRVSLERFEQDLSGNLYRIWNRLASGSYFPPAVREVSIPKKDGRTRQLGIPTVGDRIAQQVVKSYLEPRLEQVFVEHSYGYRPSKSAHQAVEAVRKNVRQYAWVVDMDIRSFFDEVDHALLLKALDRHVEERWVKLYVRRWLEAPVAAADGTLRAKEGKGTPQGGVISPLLANLFLHYTLDKWMEKRHPGIAFVRYADDAILHCQSEQEAQQVLASVSERLAACGLRLHEEKTKIVYCRDYRRPKRVCGCKFDFLGFSFQPRPAKSKHGGLFLGYDCAMSIGSRKRLVEQIKPLQIHRMSDMTIERIAQLMNPKLRGWVSYYGKYKGYELNKVFRVFHYRLVKWALNKYKRFRRNKSKGFGWLKELQSTNPELFYHWKAGFRSL